MQYLRYQMACLDIPVEKTATEVFPEMYRQLRQQLVATGNLGTRDVGFDGRTISIPADPAGYIRLDDAGAGFRATVTEMGVGVVVVKIIGSPVGAPSAMGRAIEMEYVWENWPSPVFDYAIASKAKVQLKNAPTTRITGTPAADASILSTFAGTPSIVTGAGPIDGGLTVLVDKSQVSLGTGSVGGKTTTADILAYSVKVVPAPPPFPVVDTSRFRAYATNVNTGTVHQKNIRVPASTNPTFDGGTVIDGIVYIESPNTVTFSGNSVVNGLIVFEDMNGVAENILDFRGSVSPSNVPDTPEFAELRQMAKGLALAAPSAAVTLSGATNASVTGSVIAGNLTLGGAAELKIYRGSLIALGGATTLVEGRTVHFAGNAGEDAPYQAVRVNTYFRPKPETYREVPQ